MIGDLSRHRRGAMNVLVSGGADLIGSHLLRLLYKDESGSRIMIFDSLVLATALPRWEYNRLPIKYCRGRSKGPRRSQAAMEGCYAIDHLAVDPYIAKFVTLENLNAERR